MKKFSVSYWNGDYWIVGVEKDFPTVKVKDFLILLIHFQSVADLIGEHCEKSHFTSAVSKHLLDIVGHLLRNNKSSGRETV